MALSYRLISPGLARQVKLIMTDVDGTITSGDSVTPQVLEAVRCLEANGIAVGLVSGRTISGLETMARTLGITGPLIAENGGIARISFDGPFVDLGYSRQPALHALEKLKKLYPGAIKDREDNKERCVDVVMWSLGIAPPELRRHLENVQLLDSGYILHLIAEGISKGKTLQELLDKIAGGSISSNDIIVFGDSITDISLFEMFPHSVFISNPKLTALQWQRLKEIARFASDLPVDTGFAQVVSHILTARTGNHDEACL